MKLTENVVCIGNQHFNHYIVGQEKAAVIECGVSGSIVSFRQEWGALADKPRVEYLVASHAHFDHVCGIPALRDLFPQSRLAASSEAKRVLANPKILKNFFDQDGKMAELLNEEGIVSAEVIIPSPEEIIVDTVINGKDNIDLGRGLKLEVIAVPGHSPCNLAFYLPDDQVMFPSDTAGFQISDESIFPIFFQDFSLYMESIERLMAYPAKILAVPHEKIWTGDDIPRFYQRALDAAQNAFDMIKDMLDLGMDDNIIKQELFNFYYRDRLRIYIPENISICVELLLRRVKQVL